MFKSWISDKPFITSVTLLIVSILWQNWSKADADHRYYSLFYIGFRKTWDLLFVWIRIPLLYLWLAAIILFVVFKLGSYLSKRIKLTDLARSLLSVIFTHLAIFYMLWGMNYNRINLVNRIQLNGEISDSSFYEELSLLKDRIRNQRIGMANLPTIAQYNASLMHELRPNVYSIFSKYHIGEAIPLQCKLLSPKGFLFLFGASGVYWPFVGEGYVESALHPIQIPFTMAHELCHVMGWTDEGECNLLAYLICLNSNKDYIRYSAELTLLRYMLIDLKYKNYEYYKEYRDSLPLQIQTDLNEINLTLNSYPELFPKIREYFYDLFLKSNGVSDGIRSYSNISRWIILMKKQNKIH